MSVPECEEPGKLARIPGAVAGQMLHGSAPTTHAIRATAIERFAQTVSREVWPHPEDGGQVAQAEFHRRRADGPEGATFHRFDAGGRGHGGDFPAAYGAAAGRLLLCLTSIPCLTRPALRRCFQRHGINRLPEIDNRFGFYDFIEDRTAGSSDGSSTTSRSYCSVSGAMPRNARYLRGDWPMWRVKKREKYAGSEKPMA